MGIQTVTHREGDRQTERERQTDIQRGRQKETEGDRQREREEEEEEKRERRTDRKKGTEEETLNTYRVRQNDHLHCGFAWRIQTKQRCQDLLPSILHPLLYVRQLWTQKCR